jgi:hypothetical protein
MSSPFELYDDTHNWEMDLFNEVDQEKIEIEGAPMLIWLFNLEETKKQNDSIPDDGLDLNDLYGEAPPENMVYEGPFGPIKGSYLEPIWTQDLVAFGITEPEEINIKFNKDFVTNKLGRSFVIGDIIKTFRRKFYIIEDAYVSDETGIWEYIHINVIARKVDYESLNLPGV